MSHLYKKFVTERVAGLVSQHDRIRNCTVIAHIDHGKTTLTDSLIAASGLLSQEVAASARLLDYDRIEQERGITIKASGITLVHEFEGREHLVHLVDTPGHIDFSSHVTRSLRLTDGALIVVDVIEGIMVQTETVTRQAMEELVRPVLMVNKVDRLCREKHLDAPRVAASIDRVVREFNAMLGKYLDDSLLRQWEVSFLRGSLVIGSALHKWGVGLEDLVRHAGGKHDRASLATAFMEIVSEVVGAYATGQHMSLADKYPVARAALNALVRTVPPPTVAQRYRVPAFWDGDQSSDVGRGLLSCDPTAPCVLLIGETRPDRHAGVVAVARVFSGTLERGRPLRVVRTGRTDKTLQVGIRMSRTRVSLPAVPAGNLAFLTGVTGIATGDTLVDPSVDDMCPISELRYPTEPVVTFTIEPKVLSDLGRIEGPIREFVKTDPALQFEVNPETGEMLLSGAGELHIEVTVEKLARQGVHVVLGKPMVLLKEQLSHDGEVCVAGGGEVSEFAVRALLAPTGSGPDTAGTLLDHEPHTACTMLDVSGSVDPESEAAEWVREAFRNVIRYGPVAGERMRRLALVISRADIRYQGPETSWREVTQPLIDAARASIVTGDPVLMEPWAHLEISTPEEYVGVLTSVLARRKGEVLAIDAERTLYRIVAEIPVRESFGLAAEIRTSTSGWATWGARSADYRPVPHGVSA